jgi:formylglycine-generating enzyme required for sulfatase activity
MSFPATLSDFRLDRYEISVGRFRQFVAAVEAGWRPTAPSEAEWDYAASGGSEQRVYPWSSPPTSTTIDATRATDWLGPAGRVALVGSQPAGDGRYGQSDLAGNVFEWALDGHASPYAAGSCTNCSFLLPAASSRLLRGGDFFYPAPYQQASSREVYYPPASRFDGIGARCARTP